MARGHQSFATVLFTVALQQLRMYIGLAAVLDGGHSLLDSGICTVLDGLVLFNHLIAL